MTDLTLAELRTLAWRTLPCRYCLEPAGRRCVTSSGERTTPHAARMDDIAAWRLGAASRQVEVDALDAALVARAAELETLDRANAVLTTERDDLRIEVQRLNLEVAGLSEEVARVTAALDLTTAEYAAHMATHKAPSMLVGAAVGGNSDPGPLETALGHPLALRRTYYGSSLDERNKALSTVGLDQRAGRIPFISFKAPYPWVDMAAGKGDAWAAWIGSKLAETGKPVWVVIHHEPEGDQADIAAWVGMQRRILPLLKSEHVKVGICLTGYPQVRPLESGSKYTLDKMWPGPVADFLAVDLYQRYGTTDAGLKWTPLDEFYGIVAKFAAQVGVPWGTGETGVTDEAHAADPDAVADLFAMHRKHGAAFLTYFNSSLNSKGSWPLTGSKLAAFVAEANR